MKRGKANLVIDGQWGSTGKGKLCGYLALKHDIQAAICDFMPNAGHTFVSNDGKKFINCQLPMSVLNKDCKILLGPASAINVDKLLQEIDTHKVEDRLFIHPNAVIVTQEDRDYEISVLQRISSTLKGCGGSLSRKVMRVALTAKDEPRLAKWICNTTEFLQKILISGGTVLVEGAQGFDLSLNHGHEYPYVTSRDVTPMSMLNNSGLPHTWLGDIYGCLRTYPIRVGNVFDEQGIQIGTSGPFYSDQEEITWKYLENLSKSSESLEERTTVTNKIRRVFTFSLQQFDKFIYTCAPNKLFINFINHVNAIDKKTQTKDQLSDLSILWLSILQNHLTELNQKLKLNINTEIVLVGTGECNDDMITLSRYE
jgi:adenylosuccinate synthase